MAEAEGYSRIPAGCGTVLQLSSDRKTVRRELVEATSEQAAALMMMMRWSM